MAKIKWEVVDFDRAGEPLVEPLDKSIFANYPELQARFASAVPLSSIPDVKMNPDEIARFAKGELDLAARENISITEARKQIGLQSVDEVYRKGLMDARKAGFDIDLPAPRYTVDNGEIRAYDFTPDEKMTEVAKAMQRGPLAVLKSPFVLTQMGAEAIGAENVANAANWYIQGLNGVNPDLPMSEDMRIALQRPFTQNPFLRTGVAVTESGPSFAVAVAATLATKNPNVGATILGTTSSTQTYEQLRAEGVNPHTAMVGSLLVGSIEIATERVPMDMLLKGGAKRMLTRFLSTGTAESFQELMATMGQNYVTAVARDSKYEGSLDALYQEWDTIVNGWQDAMAAGFTMGSGASFASPSPNTTVIDMLKEVRQKAMEVPVVAQDAGDAQTAPESPIQAQGVPAQTQAVTEAVGDPAAQSLTIPDQSGAVTDMTGDQASRDIAPQENAGGKGGSASDKVIRVLKGWLPYDIDSETKDLIQRVERKGEFPAFNRGEAGVKIAGFFTTDKSVAEHFAKGISKEGTVGEFDLTIGRLLVIDAEGKKAGEIQFEQQGKPFRDAVRSGNYDTILIKNTADEGDVYVALNPDNIKILRHDISSFNPPAGNAPGEQSFTPTPQPGTGETKIRGLAVSAEEMTIRKGLAESLGQLPTYETRNAAMAAERAANLIATDFDRALRIIRLQEAPPSDLFWSEIYAGLEVAALLKGDLDLITELATSEKATAMGTAAGQFIKGFDTGERVNPVKAIREIVRERQKNADPEMAAQFKELEARLAETERKLAEYQTKQQAKAQKEYGGRNKLVSKSEYEAILERRKKEAAEMRRPGKQGGFVYVPTAQDFADLAKIGMFHLEATGRSFSEWSKKVMEDLGDWVEPHLRGEYDKLSDQIEEEAYKEALDAIAAKAEDGKTISDLAVYINRIAEYHVYKGITKRGPLVDAIQSDLEGIGFDLSKREVADALSGYGKFKPLSKDEIKSKLRDIKGQLQQVSKLEDMQGGEPPKKTGVERRTPSDEERALIKQVEAMKKEYGIETTDPETQLKSALDAIKTRLRNQIADLEKQINTKTKIVKEQKEPKTDKEVEKLKETRDKLRSVFDGIFGKKTISDEKKIELALKAAKESLAEYNRKIKEKDFSVDKKKGVTSAELEKAREERDNLRKQYEKLRDAANPDMRRSFPVRSIKERLKSDIALLEDKLNRLDFEKPDKPARDVDAEEARLRKEYESARKKYNDAKNIGSITREEVETITTLAGDVLKKKQAMESGQRRERTGAATKAEMDYGIADYIYKNYVDGLKEKAKLRKAKQMAREYLSNPLEFLKDAGGVAKSIRGSMDNSFHFRQGLKVFMLGLTGDIEAAKAWGETYARSWKVLYDSLAGKDPMMYIYAEIVSDPDYDLLVKAKVATAVQEEEVPTDLPTKIPLIGRFFKAGENAFVGSAHYLRYRMAKNLLAVARKSNIKLDKYQLEGIGLVVNSLTGRGDTGLPSGALDFINNVIWSPRNLKADFDFLTMHLFDPRVPGWLKKRAAINLLRYCAGAAAILSLANFLDDDSVEWDSRSSDFGKIQAGQTRFSVGGSPAILIVLASRIRSNSKVTASGKEMELGGWGNASSDMIWNFVENKMSPSAQVIKDLIDRETRDGKTPTYWSELQTVTTPLMIETFFETKNNEDAANLLLVMMAEAHGVNVSTYTRKDKKSSPPKTKGY